MARTTFMSDDSNQDAQIEHVVLVHGTFAGSPDNAGDKWWQADSCFVNRLRNRLPENILVAATTPLPHWSGANSYADRRHGALALLDYLRPLEESHTPYHLVAHSHGGSVVWDALMLSQLADSNGEPVLHTDLRQLRSVTTVGTPFLRWQTPKWAKLPDVLHTSSQSFIFEGLQFGIYLILPALVVFFVIFLVAENVSIYTIVGLGWVSTLAMFLAMAVQSSFATSVSLAHEEHAQADAARRFGKDWLGIWSPDDEAINGLRLALVAKQPILSPRGWSRKTAFPDPLVQKFDKKDWASSSIAAAFSYLKAMTEAPLVWLRRKTTPIGNRFIWSALRGFAFGSDRLGAFVSSVKTSPNDLILDMPLPPKIAQAVLDEANRCIQSAMPRLRPLLYQLATPGSAVNQENAQAISNIGHALVHTAYFECDEIVELICAHVVSKSAGPKKSAKAPDYVTEFLVAVRERNTELGGIKAWTQPGFLERLFSALIFFVLVFGPLWLIWALADPVLGRL